VERSEWRWREEIEWLSWEEEDREGWEVYIPWSGEDSRRMRPREAAVAEYDGALWEELSFEGEDEVEEEDGLVWDCG
jgi:hypothetical protein